MGGGRHKKRRVETRAKERRGQVWRTGGEREQGNKRSKRALALSHKLAALSLDLHSQT